MCMGDAFLAIVGGCWQEVYPTTVLSPLGLQMLGKTGWEKFSGKRV